MMKRVFTLILTLLLVLSIVPAAGAELSYGEVYAGLYALAQKGQPEGEDELCFTAAWLDDGQTVAFRIRVREGVMRLCGEGAEDSVCFVLPAELPETYTVCASDGVNSGTVLLDPASYTVGAELPFTEYEGDPDAAPELQTLLEERLADLVELSGLVLHMQDAPGALGFSAFARHKYHDYDNGSVTLAPSCTEEGVRTFTCRICGETRTQAVPALGHAWKISQVTVSSSDDMHGSGKYVCSRCAEAKSGDLCACEVFTDAPAAGHWAHAGIDWAFLRGITDGTSDTRFSPNDPCTRAQVVTFLYRAAGSPAVSGSNPFSDVKASDYFYKPVLWAVRNGITDGVTATSFAPKQTCTRAQVVTFLYRAAGSPAVSGTNPFTDVKSDDYFYKPVLWAVKNGVTDGVSAASFAPKKPCTRAHVVTFLHRDSKLHHNNSPWDQSFDLWYGDAKQETRVYCAGNRAYVSKTAIEQLFSKSIPASALRWSTVKANNVVYVALADAAAYLRLGVLFREEDYSVRLYTLGQMPWTVQNGQSGQNTAYIRLEDIMADYGLNTRFTHQSLLKLRLFGDYLRDHSDGFYIAWIPLYVNGPKQLENNISTNFNFYNADFVFTLDALQADGGKIGLHGLTHQDKDNPESISSSGYEFGPQNEMTEAEIVDRFDRAKQIASELGYSWSFFEFPHYATTAFQRQVADKHFDVVYQQDPDVPYAQQGQIVTHTVGSHKCRWVPTPADYVNGRSDLPNVLNRLQTSYNKNQVLSLFFHPNVDTYWMELQFSGSVLSCSYDQQSCVIPNVVRLITELGYRFGLF